jgi:hypothetical protein
MMLGGLGGNRYVREGLGESIRNQPKPDNTLCGNIGCIIMLKKTILQACLLTFVTIYAILLTVVTIAYRERQFCPAR